MLRLIRNRKVRDVGLQVAFVGTLVALVVSAILTAHGNLAANGIASGFAFLRKSTGWDLNFSLLPVTAYDPYWWYIVIGITNTLFLGTIGLVLATLVGSVIGIARSSSNELARLLGAVYVETFRNIPLVLQVIFWFALLSHLPGPRQAIQFGGAVLSNRGLYLPILNIETWAIGVSAAVSLVTILGAALVKGRSARWGVVAAGVALVALISMLGRVPEGGLLSVPAVEKLNIRGGLRVPPEIAAMAIAIGIYGGAYIGEIVRGGFKAVGRGQVEAAQALGLSEWQAFSRVRAPLALRAMLPILANQYVWLIKATTLGIVIGFNDFFMVVTMMITHSGQTLEAILILMAGFLVINFTIGAIFNRINSAIALKGNQLRS